MGYESAQVCYSSQQEKIIDHLPYTDGLPRKIAASGAWINPDEYELRIYFYETPARITYNFSFEEGELIWKSKLEHSLFGPISQEQLTGK